MIVKQNSIPIKIHLKIKYRICGDLVEIFKIQKHNKMCVKKKKNKKIKKKKKKKNS